MGAPTRTPRNSWIDKGLLALAVGGPDAVRIEQLAEALGVTKGGFYWHFDDRRALLEEMLDTWERVMVDDVIERVEAEPGDARAKLRRLFTLGSSVGDLMKIELAIRDWARRDKAVARRLKRIDNRRMQYMRSLLGDFCADEDEVEIRCLIVMSLFIGAPNTVVNTYYDARYGEVAVVTDANGNLIDVNAVTGQRIYPVFADYTSAYTSAYVAPAYVAPTYLGTNYLGYSAATAYNGAAIYRQYTDNSSNCTNGQVTQIFYPKRHHAAFRMVLAGKK